MGQQSTPQFSIPSGPSAEQLAIANMGRFANQPDSVASILAGLNTLLTPTMSPTSGAGVTNVLLGLSPTTSTHTGAGMPSLSAGAGGAAQPSTASSLLSGLVKSPGALKNVVGSIENALSPSMDSALGLTAANSTVPALTASQMAPIGTGAVTAAGNAAGTSAANELAAAGFGGGDGAAASPAIAQAIADYAPGAAAALAAPTMQTIGTGAADAVANQAEASAAQELANAGYGSGASAAGSAGSGLAGDASTALGALGAGYSAYNTIKNWQSGNTGSDALNGAETGASVGTMIAPGIGTVLGGLIGGAAGAASSAFGGGRPDPETQNWNSLAAQYDSNPGVMSGASPAQLYQGLAGVMDAKNNSPGHSEPIEQVFGRMGEQNLMDAMTNYVNSQYKSGGITPGESIAQQWSQTVYPWLAGQGATINPNQRTSSGANEGGALISDLQGLLGGWESGAITPSSQLGINGQTIGGLANFLGAPAAAAPAAFPTSQPMSPIAAMMLRGRGMVR